MEGNSVVWYNVLYMQKILVTIVVVIVITVASVMYSLWSPAVSPDTQVPTAEDTNQPAGVVTGNSQSAATGQTGAQAQPSPSGSTVNNSNTANTGTTPGAYTMAVVATHDSSASCWTAVNGSVYDVTKWITQHPGGQQAIMSICGKDGTAEFTGQHGGERRPEKELSGFKIGTLAK